MSLPRTAASMFVLRRCHHAYQVCTNFSTLTKVITCSKRKTPSCSLAVLQSFAWRIPFGTCRQLGKAAIGGNLDMNSSAGSIGQKSVHGHPIVLCDRKHDTLLTVDSDGSLRDAGNELHAVQEALAQATAGGISCSWFMVRPLAAHWACKGQVGCAITLDTSRSLQWHHPHVTSRDSTRTQLV